MNGIKKKNREKRIVTCTKKEILAGIISAIMLSTALGYGLHNQWARNRDSGHTIGIVTEIHMPGLKSHFKYKFTVGYIQYIGSNSFYSANIQPGDTVYVIYEKKDPDNNILKLEDIGWGGSGDPIYSKRCPDSK